MHSFWIHVSKNALEIFRTLEDGSKDAKKNARYLENVLMSAMKCMQMRKDAGVAIRVASLRREGVDLVVKFKIPNL
ncbi:hypothetical protein PIB30_031531 [Stylosanthes scabra]|uniref:Uncharacterized protein n=1 Tax=Stylosanthes scabra TaxID=79078 RepID=A0ABU6ZAG6_9FABA|nr:hypothetical protein [Stylosanthes scabra]